MLRTAAHAELPSKLQVHEYLVAQGHSHGLQTVWPFAGRRLDVYKLFSTVVIAGGSEQVRSLHAFLAFEDLNAPR